MIANFIYSNLNPCGGGERFTLVTMQAVLDMNIDIELTTLETPIISKLENAYGKDLVCVLNNIKKINVLQLFDEENINEVMKKGYDIIINTHGDIDPFYHPTLSKNNAITYCHFPSAKYFIQNEDKEYLEKHLKVTEISTQSTLTTSNNFNNTITEINHSIQKDSTAFNKKNI